jgi:hypothetical protein
MATGIRTFGQDGNSVVVNLGSGSYRFAYRLAPELPVENAALASQQRTTGRNFALLSIVLLALTGNYLVHLARAR